MILQNIHKTHDGRTTIALCDEVLLGKSFEEGNKLLDVKTTYYSGEPFNEKEFESVLTSLCSINAVGEESVKLLKAKNLAADSDVLFVDNVPYTIVSVE